MASKQSAGAQPMVWHYTVQRHLPGIIASEEIRPATAGVPRGERPVVWFSANPEWEATANKDALNVRTGMVERLSRERTHDLFGLARIGVAPESAPHDWEAFK